MKVIISCVVLLCSGTFLTLPHSGEVMSNIPSGMCHNCRPILLSTISRIGEPADVDMPQVRALRNDSKSMTAVRRWFDGREYQTRLMQSGDIRKKHWVGIAIPQNGEFGSEVIYASGFGHQKIILIQEFETGAVSRSTDSGASWREFKLQVDGHPAPEWIHEFDDTPGVRAIVRLSAVSPHDSETLFAAFQLWVPHRGKLAEFSAWKEVPGMYVSHDGGDNWTLFTKDLVFDSPLGIGRDPNYFVGLRKDGIVISRDGGRSWQAYGGQQFLNQKVEIKGRNTGSHETARNSVPIRINQIEIAAANASTIYLRTNIGLLITRDGGRTWCVATPGSHVMEEAASLAVSRDNPNDILISTSATAEAPPKIFHSTNGGCTFAVVYGMNGRPHS